MKKVVVPMANGFEEIEAITIIDILRRAGAEVTIAGVSKRNLTGAHAVEIVADSVVAEVNAQQFDMLALAGGYDNAISLANDAKTQDLIKEMNSAGKFVTAICASPLALHSAGVLDGKKYTCYPSVEKSIGGNFTGEDIAVDGNIITSKGPATAGIFALFLVEKLFGSGKKDEVASAMLYS